MTQPNEFITRVDQLTFTGTVLREFKGKLQDLEPFQDKQQAKVRLQFVDMAMIRSLQDYPFPAAELVMNRVNRKGEVSDRGPWGAFILASSLQGYPDCMELKGKVLHMRAKENKIDADEERNQSEGMFLTWEILAVDDIDRRAAGEPADDDSEDEPAAKTK